ncbi:MAG: nucleoside-diphosphate kinase [Eubacteriales bacterium]|nr:nucleoside-diphosphate kinase [Eubacteriales bacterium]
MERTLVMLKPDAIRRKLAGEIITRFEKRDLRITQMRMMTLEKSAAEEHYSHVSHEPFYKSMIDFITSGPVLVMVIEGEHVVKMVRSMLGSLKTYDSPSGTIRGDLGSHFYENLIHASDSPETAEKEIKRFLGKQA